MLLKNLINNLSPDVGKLKIRGLSLDSRNVKKGDLFISIKGNKFNANNYIEEAISKGAKAVIYSGSVKKKYKNIILIKVKDTRKKLAELSTKYYKNKPKNIVAVTGTNGKTSVSDFFYQIFLLEKKKVGALGTLGFKKNKSLKKRELTTLDSLNLNRDLNEMKKTGIDNAIIEASSHGLHQSRLNFLNIKTGIFTNLSHDHLDYHKSMKNYLNSKLILFKNILKKRSTIITDSDIKQYGTLKNIQKKKKLKIYTIGHRGNIFKVLNHKIFKNFQLLEIKYNKKIYHLKINLYGSIQIKNLLMAILACKTCGLNIKNIFKKINKIHSVDGRLELIRNLPNKSKIFLDYAHTPDALKNAILSLQEHFRKKITIIFGCGGERDKGKRRLMGKITKNLCNKIYVTDDNPRNENPKKIRNDIIKGLRGFEVNEVPNRKKAIHTALKNSDPYEIILIAGKGHEAYQDLGKRKIFLSDKKIVKNFNIHNSFDKKKNNLQYNGAILKKVLKDKKKYFFNNVSINSKKIKSNNLFVAIKGKKNDGHNFLNEAIKGGASYCVISKKIKKKSNFIKVKNTMKFLKILAQNKRDLSSAKFIAVTGSSGKTTIKTMLGNLLKKYSNSYFSPQSYNNQYGVPLSICNIAPQDDFGVFEIGMSKFKEIFNLSSLVKPDIAIITNISEAHLENFKNIRDIAKAKSEIIYNIQRGGVVILNRDDKFFHYFKKIAEKNNIKIKSFGYSKQAHVRFINIKKNRGYLLLKLSVNNKNILLKINNINRNYIMNILCCVAVLSELNLNLKKINNFFKTLNFLEGRGKINKVNKFYKKFFLIDESYNANPLSVRSAIENFSNLQKKGKRKYFLFGDMLELGRNSYIYHKKISKFINNSDIDKTFVYGDKATETYKLLRKSKRGAIVKNFKSFDNRISQILKNGDFLMIKGSNAMKLHEISKRFLRSN